MVRSICISQILCPQIKQLFDADLLSRPMPKLRDFCETLEKMIQKIEGLWYKLDSNPIKKTRCEKLKQEILNLYERAKVKEKDREREKDHKTQGFGYSFVGFEGNGNDVYWRLRFGRKAGAHRHVQ